MAVDATDAVKLLVAETLDVRQLDNGKQKIYRQDNRCDKP